MRSGLGGHPGQLQSTGHSGPVGWHADRLPLHAVAERTVEGNVPFAGHSAVAHPAVLLGLRPGNMCGAGLRWSANAVGRLWRYVSSQ